jgi:hypothetical protein
MARGFVDKSLETTYNGVDKSNGHQSRIGIAGFCPICTKVEARSEIAGQALEQFERSFASADEMARFYKLKDLARAAFEAGDTEKARKYATELFVLLRYNLPGLE